MSAAITNTLPMKIAKSFNISLFIKSILEKPRRYNNSQNSSTLISASLNSFLNSPLPISKIHAIITNSNR
jgi:hypothetical protein